jgi:hypothetical protein
VPHLHSADSATEWQIRVLTGYCAQVGGQRAQHRAQKGNKKAQTAGRALLGHREWPTPVTRLTVRTVGPLTVLT